MSPIRVLSLNLWNLNEPLSDRMQNLQEFLRQNDPDLVVLQEVSPTAPAWLQTDSVDALGQLYSCYQATGEWLGRPEGLAVFSRYPMATVRGFRLPGRESDMDRGLLHVTLEANGSRLHIFNTHLAFRVEDEDLRLAQAAAVAERASLVQLEFPDDPILLCGDLNDTPESSTVQTFETIGLCNAFTDHEAGAFTFASRNPYVDPKLAPDRRIDHVFVSPFVDVLKADVVLDDPGSLASDHYGLLLELSLR